MQRLREEISEVPSPERVEQMRREGWKPAVLEWHRAAEAGDRHSEQDIPYGLTLEPEGARLVEEPHEQKTLMAMMELIVADKRISQVAEEMNRRGFRMRSGGNWTPGAVFDLLPRLVEVGPSVFTSSEWVTRKKEVAAP